MDRTQRMLPRETGSLMLAIILSSSVLYEMIGPVCAKLALVFSGCIPSEHLLETDLVSERQQEKTEKKAEEKEGKETEGLNVKQESFAEIVEEMNAGVDERDDDDIEKVIPVQEEKEKDKEKKKKKHRKVERKGA